MPKPLAVVPELEAELDSLYAAPPADFTSARNDLAQRLKQAGQVEAAAAVKQLRKPTVPLWAVNQLARRHPEEVRALLDAGERLRVAQQAALRGESEELRTATAEERKILQGLTQRGAELLRETGHSADPKRIADTLRAAAVDESGRKLLQLGRLSEELEASGFGGFAGMEMPARSKPSDEAALARSATPARGAAPQAARACHEGKAGRDEGGTRRGPRRSGPRCGAPETRRGERVGATRRRRVGAGREVSATRP